MDRSGQEIRSVRDSVAKSEYLLTNFPDISIDKITNSIYMAMAKDPHLEAVTEWYFCKQCELHCNRTQVIFGSGSYNSKIVVIGEAPGPREDEEGVVFCGPTGTLLRLTLKKLGLDTVNEVYFTNTLGCIPKDSKNSGFRAPNPSEIEACLPRVKYILDKIFPNRYGTLLLGKPAYVTFKNRNTPEKISEDNKLLKMADVLGWHKEDNAPPAFVAYHPSYIMRRNDKELTQSWINSIGEFVKFVKEAKNAER